MASVPQPSIGAARQELYRRMDRTNLAPLMLEAQGETVLFSFSDRPGQEAMGLWREQRG